MRLTFTCVGRLSREYASVWKHYEALLRPFCTLEVMEIPEIPLSRGIDRVKKQEGEAMVRLLRPGAYTVVLDSRGTQYTSKEWSALLAREKLHGFSHFQFLLGGAAGLEDRVLARARVKWSLSKMTFPHQMARCIALEQIYRAIRIERGEPYHH